MTAIETAKALLARDGYVVVKERTYRNMQEKNRLLLNQLEWEKRATERARQWGVDAHAEVRRVSERLTFVYGEARAAGVTVEQLEGGVNFPVVRTASELDALPIGSTVMKVGSVWAGSAHTRTEDGRWASWNGAENYNRDTEELLAYFGFASSLAVLKRGES